MALGFVEILLVLLTGGGGGNDLLDYLPTAAYWKAKGVETTAERMAAELATEEPADAAKLVRDLGADGFATREAAMQKLRAMGPAAAPALEQGAENDDPEVKMRARQLLERVAASGGTQAKAVRRLMAVRALGDLKRPESLAALRPLLASKEPFVADYARQAVAAIEGKPYQRPRPTRAMLWKDVCLLPAECAVVAQVAMPGGGPIDVATALKGIEGKLPQGRDPAAMIAQLAQMLTVAAERVGNVRLDAVTLGVTGEVGDDAGFVVIIARGLYDRTAAKATIRQLGGCEAAQVGGVDVLRPEEEVALILASRERLVLLAGDRRVPKPVEALVAALGRNGDKPTLDPKMLALIKSIDTSSPAWAVVRMTDCYRQVPLFAPFDTVTMASKVGDGGAMALTVVAAGKDAEAVKPAVAELNAGIEKAKAGAQQALAQMPAIKPMVDFVNSIRVEQQGATVTLTGKLQGQASAMMMPLVMLFGVRTAHIEGPAPVEVQPARPMPK